MKNYLILSDDLISINSYIDKIIKDNKLNKENIIKYVYDSNLDKIIEDLNTYGFLVDNKVIIVENCSFLESKKNTETEDLKQDDLKELTDYINNPNEQNILVLINSKQDNKKKINKLINEKFIIYNTNFSIEDKIKDLIKDYNMNSSSIKYLIDICDNNNERIVNEINKLKMYKFDEKEITNKDIDDIVIKNLNEDIFAFINAVIKNDKKKCFDIYNRLIEKGEPIQKMLVLIADQFRLIYTCKVLNKDGKSNDFIATYLGIHPYRVKLAVESSYNFTEKQLLNYLKELSKIDIKMKSNSSDSIDFEMFIINL